MSEALKAQIAQLQSENLKAKVTLKISEKGCLLICGMRKLPIAMYRNEFETIMELSELIRGFMKAHDGEMRDWIT